LQLDVDPGFHVLAIRRGGRYVYRPRGHVTLAQGDELIASGPDEGHPLLAARLGWRLEEDEDTGQERLEPLVPTRGPRSPPCGPPGAGRPTAGGGAPVPAPIVGRHARAAPGGPAGVLAAVSYRCGTERCQFRPPGDWPGRRALPAEADHLTIRSVLSRERSP